jgi:hypothetical protein
MLVLFLTKQIVARFADATGFGDDAAGLGAQHGRVTVLMLDNC